MPYKMSNRNAGITSSLDIDNYNLFGSVLSFL
jgi:hypothetical protein